MDRTPVSSSHIAAIGYDPTSMTLEVEFSDGAVYQYFDVPEAVHQELMQADFERAVHECECKKLLSIHEAVS